SASSRATSSPLRLASSASPNPVAPPPMINRSNTRPSDKDASKADRWMGMEEDDMTSLNTIPEADSLKQCKSCRANTLPATLTVYSFHEPAFMTYLLAFDQGTSSTRSIVFDTSGRAIGTAQQDFAQIYPHPGRVEHNATEIWQTQ